MTMKFRSLAVTLTRMATTEAARLILQSTAKAQRVVNASRDEEKAGKLTCDLVVSKQIRRQFDEWQCAAAAAGTLHPFTCLR